MGSRRSSLGRWAGAATVALALHAGGAALALMHWQEEDLSEDAAGPIMVELAPLPVASPIDMPDVAHGPLMEEAMLTPQAAKQTVEEVEKEIPPVEQSPLAPDPEVTLPVPRPVEEKKPEEKENQEAVPQQQAPDQTVAAPLTTAPPRVEAKPAAVAAAPTPGASANPSRAQATWQKALINHLNRYKRYPDGARARGVQGSVSVQFTLDRAGQVVASRVLRSSGSTLLDEEALAVLQRASPLPTPPDQLAGATFDLSLPIQFRIR
jgi:protein TonB